MNHDVITLAHDLCAIRSETGNEIAVAEWLCAWLSNNGFITEKIAVDSRRYNIFAYVTRREKYNVIFCTHLDTVLPFIAPSIRDNVLWGRGSCDAKGIAAAMCIAASTVDDAALLFTVGEEESSDGAKACSNQLAGRARFLVVGEPTSMHAAFAQKGTVVFDLHARGISAHSSMPHLGSNAIHHLNNAIANLIRHEWPRDPQFMETLINFGEIAGGSMRNVLADCATAKGIMRTSKESLTIISMMKSVLDENVCLDVLSCTDPFSYFTPPGFPTFLATFGSDAPYLRDVGTPILIGPGSLHYAHRDDEHITFAEIRAGVAGYREIASLLRNA